MGYTRKAEEVLGELSRALRGIDEKEVTGMVACLNRENRIFCDGAGRSRLQAEGFAMRLAQMGFLASVVGEATAPAITQNDILIILSGSGETPVLLEHGKKAKEAGALVLAITASPHSSLSELCDVSVIVKADRKDQAGGCSMQPMGTLFEQSAGILCDTMVLLLMDRFHITGEEMFRNHSNLE